MFSTANPMALATVSSAVVVVGVDLVVRVALGTVRRGLMLGYKVLTWVAPKDVLATRDRLKVGNANTILESAASLMDVVKSVSIGNHSAFMFIQPTVSLNALAVEPEDS